jgi:uncharacterized coiled-coil protein SlyX
VIQKMEKDLQQMEQERAMKKAALGCQQIRKAPVSEALDDLQKMMALAQEQMARIVDKLNPVLSFDEQKLKSTEMPPHSPASCGLESRIRDIYFEMARFNDGLHELSARIRV